jgi:hypothetical protein
MEVITVASIILPLISSLGTLIIQTQSFVSEVRSAQKDIDAVNSELSTLKQYLEVLREEIVKNDYPQGAKSSLIGILQGCGETIHQMAALLTRYSSGNVRKDVQWALFGRGEMEKLRSKTERDKGFLSLAVSLVGM